MARPPTLERCILELLWTGGEWSVRAVLDKVGGSLARTKDSGVWKHRAARTPGCQRAGAESFCRYRRVPRSELRDRFDEPGIQAALEESLR